MSSRGGRPPPEPRPEPSKGLDKSPRQGGHQGSCQGLHTGAPGSEDAPLGIDTYKRLLAYVIPHKRPFLWAAIGMVFYSITETAFAWLMKPMLDGSFVDQDPQAILLVPLAIIGLFLVRGAAGYASTYYMAWIGWSVIKALRGEIFAKYLSLPTSFYDSASSGELISRITFNSQLVANAASTSITVLIRDTLSAIGLFGLMLYHSWQLSLCFLIIGPLIGLIVARVSKQFRAVSRSIQGSMGDVSHVIQEAVDGSREIKIFGGQDDELLNFEQANETNRRYNMRETRIKALNAPMVQFLVAVALAIIVYMASSGIASETVTVGAFMSFITAMLLLFPPMRRLTNLNNELQKGIAAGESLFAMLDIDSERDQGADELQRPVRSIQYYQAGLRYRADTPVVLADIDLSIREGETVAFVGESGSGKSSLVNLLPRLYDADSGEVRINDKAITEYRLRSLREAMAVVGQDVTLFNDTIANNVAYGSSRSATQEAIEAACQAANAHGFISRLDHGYDTEVGENGVMLSGGQRQRLAIARALLKDAPILILDEATSALDSESERKVQAGLEALMHGRTTLVIAHRLSTVESADRIIVLDKGRIVEEGAHAALLAANGRYTLLHKMQFA